MGIITALAVVIGVMGGVATSVWLEVGSIYWVIWITFIGWASFYAAGGGTEGIMKSVAANVWGVVVAAISLFVFTKLAPNMNVSLAAGLCVGIAIIVLILAAYVPQLGFIPGQVFGYAPTAGLFLTNVAVAVTAADGTVTAAAPAYSSVWVVMIATIISLVIGNALGLISEKIGGAVAKS